MKTQTTRLLAAILVSSALLSGQTAPPRAADLANKKEIIARARQAYYSLRARGLSEFSAAVTPNWEVALRKEIQSNPEGARKGLRLLDGLHFGMTLDHNGDIKVTHRADVSAPNPQA